MHMTGSSQPQHFFAEGCIFADFAIAVISGGAASQHIGLPVCLSARLSVCLFQLASGEVLLTILTSTIVGEYRRVFNNYPGPKNE